MTMVAALAAACGGPPEATDVHVVWERVWERTGEAPGPPVVGEPVVADLSLTDAEGRPIRGATLEIEGYMSHPGMAPVLASAEDLGEGRYRARFALTMAGDWTVLVRGVLPDGRTVRHQVDLAGVQPSG